jgi:hypothetical protein
MRRIKRRAGAVARSKFNTSRAAGKTSANEAGFRIAGYKPMRLMASRTLNAAHSRDSA